jgi:ELWxxDGT repeat protein
MITWFGVSLRKRRTGSLASRLNGRKSSCRSVLQAEVLEDRILPSFSPRLLKDINRATDSSDIRYLTQVNSLVFFEIYGPAHFVNASPTRDIELWESNGAPAGTHLVKVINPASRNSQPSELTNVNGTLFFTADDGTFGEEVWKSNGTYGGTVLVKDIVPGKYASYPKYLTNVSGTLFFDANDRTHGEELWKSNGTPAGTALVKDIGLGNSSSFPSDLTNLNGTLFFSANDGVHGSQLWRTNGAPASTFRVTDITTGGSSFLGNLANVSGSIFFFTDPVADQLWKSNGTAAGTFFVKNVGSSPRYLTNVNGTLFFSAYDRIHKDELWESNGSPAGTFLVKDINPTFSPYPSHESSYPSYLTNVNGTLFFEANDGVHGRELWESNGTSVGTFLVKDINPGPAFSDTDYLHGHPGVPLVNMNGTLFFHAFEGTHGFELWKSNGTAAGTQILEDILPGSGGSYPAYLTNVHGTLFFRASDGIHGTELWRSNGSSAGTFLVSDINRTALGSYPRQTTNVNGTLFFSAVDTFHGRELWRTNGTSAGTVLVKDINPGVGSSYPGGLTNVNGTLFFAADDGTHGSQLWRSDGTAAGTFLVKEVVPPVYGLDSASPNDLTNVNGTLFFEVVFYDFNLGRTDDGPWESNGTAAGTFRLGGISLFSYPSFTNVNGTLFFAGYDGTHGPELWKSNGMPGGTRLASSVSDPSYLINANGTLFFRANGDELWKSNGSAAGTFALNNIQSSPGFYPGLLTNVNGTVFFLEDDGVGSRELWKSNGTVAGTVLVKGIDPVGFAFLPENVNGTLFLQAQDDTHGRELWKTNGSTAGTFLVKDIGLGSAGSDPCFLTNVNDTLFFQANNGTHGIELWESNGSPTGTFLVHDINRGPPSSNPSYLANVNGTLFFSANDGVHGAEPWILPLPTPPPASLPYTPPPMVARAERGIMNGVSTVTGTVANWAARTAWLNARTDSIDRDTAPRSHFLYDREPGLSTQSVDELFAQRIGARRTQSLGKVRPHRLGANSDWQGIWY